MIVRAPRPQPLRAPPLPRAFRWRKSLEFWWALALVGLVALAFATFDGRYRHWFILPVAFSGALIVTDLLQWLRSRGDLFDPAGILSVLGVHFFFLAPLLHVLWDIWMWNGYWMAIIAPPRDWRPWLGLMATLNCAGLVLYRWAHAKQVMPSARPYWRIDRTRFIIFGAFFVAVALTAQVIVFAQFGGISGYIATFERGIDNFRGYGFMLTIAESLPILLVMIYAAIAQTRPLLRAWAPLLVMLVGYLGLRLIFGGLAGSRANLVWGLFWAVGIVHMLIRPLSRRWLVASIPLLLVFMYVYGFYKAAGRRGLDAITSESAREEQIENSGRSAEFTLLGDLARADVQAYILYATDHPRMRYEWALGRTYVGGLALLVPSRIWPSRPDTKVRESTNVVFGPDTYAHTEFRSTKIHGLAGEAVLNFGMWSVPVAFLLLGLLIHRYRQFAASLVPGDCRLMLLPFLSTFCFLVLSMDSDVLVFYVFKQGLLPILLVLVGSQRLRTMATTAA